MNDSKEKLIQKLFVLYEKQQMGEIVYSDLINVISMLHSLYLMEEN